MTLPSDPDAPDTSPGPLYDVMQRDLVALVESARHAAARRVNSLMSATYWEIGRRLVETEQQGSERAEYGEALIERLALDLTASLGRGFSTTNLRQMRAFHLAWPANSIRQTVSGELPGRVALDPDKRLARLADAVPFPWSAYVALLGDDFTLLDDSDGCGSMTRDSGPIWCFYTAPCAAWFWRN